MPPRAQGAGSVVRGRPGVCQPECLGSRPWAGPGLALLSMASDQARRSKDPCDFSVVAQHATATHQPRGRAGPPARSRRVRQALEALHGDEAVRMAVSRRPDLPDLIASAMTVLAERDAPLRGGDRSALRPRERPRVVARPAARAWLRAWPSRAEAKPGFCGIGGRRAAIATTLGRSWRAWLSVVPRAEPAAIRAKPITHRPASESVMGHEDACAGPRLPITSSPRLVRRNPASGSWSLSNRLGTPLPPS